MTDMTVDDVLHLLRAAGNHRWVDMIQSRIAKLEREAEAGVNLWHYLCENDIAWSEDQDFFVELGLLERVDVPADIAEEDRCRNCCGECDQCYRPTDLLKWEPDAPADGGEHA